MGSDQEIAGFILGLLVDGPRRSRDIHELVERHYGLRYLLGPRKVLDEQIETGVRFPRDPASYWRIVGGKDARRAGDRT